MTEEQAKRQNPVLDHLKQADAGEGPTDGVVTLSTGYKARIVPVGSTILE
jgi:hypothetical protein